MTAPDPAGETDDPGSLMRYIQFIRSGVICAVYDLGSIPPAQFFEMFQEQCADLIDGCRRRFTVSVVYCEWWKEIETRSERATYKIISVEPHTDLAYEVTGIDLRKWKR